jgi:hypothetical protein
VEQLGRFPLVLDHHADNEGGFVKIAKSTAAAAILTLMSSAACGVGSR